MKPRATKRQFETYQPLTIEPNQITSPDCYNGMCLIRRYRVTVEEIEEPREVLIERLRTMDIIGWDNIKAAETEAQRLGFNCLEDLRKNKP